MRTGIPVLNIEAFRKRYPQLTQCYDDDELLEIYADQVDLLGIQTYSTTGYLKQCCYSNCTEHSDYNYRLLKLATCHQLFLEQRGGDGSAGVTGQINFSETYGIKTGFATDLDKGYNGSAYGTPYWNESNFGKQILTITQKNVVRVRYTTDRNMGCNQCKRPEEAMITSQTLRIGQNGQLTIANLWLSPDNYLSNELLEIRYKDADPLKPYLAIKQNALPFYTPGSGIDITQEKIIQAHISEDANNALEIGADDGLFVAKATDFNLVDGVATTVTDNETSKQIDVNISDRSDNALQLLPDNKLYVAPGSTPSVLVDGQATKISSPQTGQQAVNVQISKNQGNIADIVEDGIFVPQTEVDLSNYYTKQQTNQQIIDATAPLSEQINTVNQNLVAETNRATQEESNLQKQFPKFQNIQISSIVAKNGISGSIDQAGLLSLGLDIKNNYFVTLPLSDIGGESALKTCSLVWSNGATAKAVEGLPLDTQGIGLDQGFYAVFKNPNVSPSGSTAYNLTLRMLVFFNGDIGDGTTNFTIGDNTIRSAFTTWIAGITPKGDFTQHTSPMADVYPITVNNYGITELEIVIKDPIYIENKFQTFFVGADMAAWFTSKQGVELMAFESIDFILTPI